MAPPASSETGWREHWRAAGANAYFDDFAEPLLELAVAHLGPNAARAGRLLDVGCGRGRNAELFRRLGMDVTGIDLDEAALAQARQKFPQIDFQIGDVQKLAFPDAAFDAVFSSSVLQYVDWPLAIRQCHRVLKPGGRAVFVEHLRGNPIAVGYRLLHRLLGWRYGKYQTPRAHLDWKELPEFRQVFSAVEIHPLHLATPLALVWPLLRSKALHRPFEMRTKRLYRALRRFDQSTLRHCPSLRQRCWQVVIQATK
jgi:SAM-dependent methyltransferase